jgi:hypothetical protein
MPAGLMCQEKPPQPLSTAQLFQWAHFESRAAKGKHADIRWKVRGVVHGLSVHQRMFVHLEIDVPGSELVKRSGDGELIGLVQVIDQHGNRYHDYGRIELSPMKSGLEKQTLQSTWEAFALPGRYKARILLFDKRSEEYNFTEIELKVPALKRDPFPQIWEGVPGWEFWAPLKELPDSLYRPDIESRLNLRLRTRQPIDVDILADLTPSDLFHGSTRFYERFLAVALPLVKDLSQMQVSNGSLHVAALDLSRRKITFEQDDGRALNWPALRRVVALENGPGSVDVARLKEKHEDPDFLRDEVLRRLSLPSEADDHAADHQGKLLGKDVAERTGKPLPAPFHVFIIVGSPMDFYAFHHFPQVDPALAENCVVYYLQYEIYGPYATGALGKVRKMLKPLTIHTIKVRSGESVREALGRIVREVGQM